MKTVMEVCVCIYITSLTITKYYIKNFEGQYLHNYFV